MIECKGSTMLGLTQLAPPLSVKNTFSLRSNPNRKFPFQGPSLTGFKCSFPASRVSRRSTLKLFSPLPGIDCRCTLGDFRKSGKHPGRCRASPGSTEFAVDALANREPPAWQLVRLRVVALVALALALCNADRVIMSVAIMPLSAVHGWGPGTAGIVQSSFLWGYLLTPILGGALADRYGGHLVLGCGICLWSAATCLTPWAAGHSLGALLAVRTIMGVGEGVALPCMNNLMARWMPPGERARAVGICFAGFHLGSVGGLLSAPLLMASPLGTMGPFLVFGGVGIAWLFVWLAAGAAAPRLHPSISPRELEFILHSQIPPPPDPVAATQAASDAARALQAEPAPREADRKLPPFRLLLSKAATWAIIWANVVNNWGYFVLLSWMPVYFSQVLGVDSRGAAWLSAAPWGIMAAVGCGAGAMADLLRARGTSTTAIRKAMQTVGFGGPGVALLALVAAEQPAMAATCFSVALGLSAFSQAGFLVNYQDIGPRYAGVLHGMSNTAGTVAGIGSTVVAGFLLQQFGSFRAVLLLTSVIYLSGVIVWNLFSTGKLLFP